MLEPLRPTAMALTSERRDEIRPVENESRDEMEATPSATTIWHAARDAQTTATSAALTQPSPTPAEPQRAAVSGTDKAEEPTSAPSSYRRQFSPATSRYVLGRLHQARDSKPSPPALIAAADERHPATPAAAEEAPLHCPVDLSSLPRTLHLPDATPAASPSTTILDPPPPPAGTKRKHAADHEGGGVGGPRRPASLAPAYPEPEILRRPMSRPPTKRKRTRDDGNGNPMCARCKRTSWTDANLIVACASCGEAWHQLCHDQPATLVPGDDDGGFRCATCEDEEKEQAEYQRQIARYREAKQEQAEWRRRQNDVERRREKRLAALPVFPDSRIIGFEGGDASPEERREYFENLKKSDLVNLLIFSNDIYPGLLVDLLVSVSKRHPDLPIFGSPDWVQPKAPRREPQRQRQRQRQGNHARLKVPKQRSKTGGVRKILKTTPVAPAAAPAAAGVAGVDGEQQQQQQHQQQEDDEYDDDGDDDDDDALPESWPKAGHGLYSKLKPEREDPLLFDDKDEEAFSHFMVDEQGRQVVELLAA
ncbi:PHD-finger domain-containing protein [Colletotrichum graminicola]|uniref:PHD-finger domain-containing protein n=1 Tax=Colletotrichum graminicola (strain M1.001 / M2 / FGSC 10212) TaxID=645133 RepID=E3QNM8_COLGM|nr:PHD-finger domain-containing protein [Colletotrichum graminicola M1.001]EFQ32515.1 PHD-finger domain-containing protein [Colletotrichum graminicola M1.001]WDK14669.1 PHD-finger domain-containing protein [Colletotrichum graminicola]